MCLGRPHTKSRRASNARSQPGAIRTPVVPARYALSRSEVHTSNGRPGLGGVPQAVVCRRIAKYLPELFGFVGDPAVPSTNNAAERSVRPVVVQRKVSGGTRSPAGTGTFTTLATLFGTWRARGLDPLLACRRLLLDPAPTLPV